MERHRADTDRPQYLEISPWLGNFQHKGNHGVTPEAVIVLPTWGKAQYHKEIKSVWQQAAQYLSEAEHIFIFGYSLPVTDQFFHLRLKRLWVFDPDQARQIQPRYEQMLGQAARNRFFFKKLFFRDVSTILREELKVAERPPKPRL